MKNSKSTLLKGATLKFVPYSYLEPKARENLVRNQLAICASMAALGCMRKLSAYDGSNSYSHELMHMGQRYLNSIKEKLNRPNTFAATLTGIHKGIPYQAVEFSEGTKLTARLRASILKQVHQIIRNERTMRRRVETTQKRRFGTVINYTGGVHTQSGVIMGMKNRIKKGKIKASKSPSTSVRHVGVEIEFFCPSDRDDVEDALIAASLENYVQVKSDGSIQPDGGDAGDCDCDYDNDNDEHQDGCSALDDENEDRQYGHELCVLAAETEYADIIRRVCAVLNTLNAEVNRTCGLHVHLDVRARDKTRVFNNLAKAYPVLAALVPVERRTNSYCKQPKYSTLAEELDLGDRYQAINAQSIDTHKTIEVRLHSGTANAVKINNWVSLLVRIADAEEIKAITPTLERLSKAVSIPVRLMNYLTKRTAKFASKEKSSWHALSNLNEDAA